MDITMLSTITKQSTGLPQTVAKHWEAIAHKDDVGF